MVNRRTHLCLLDKHNNNDMGLFSRTRKPFPPYDTLQAEQRYALYFLLEYLTTRGTIPLDEMGWALQYLDKAAIYFGMTKRQIEEFKPFYNTYEKIVHISSKSRIVRFSNI